MKTSILVKSPSIVHWLNSFLNSRNSCNNTGQPLYQYHMTNDEYLSLRRTLAESYKFEVKNTLSKEWCGAFILYCSEWFRREYSGDWSWQPIYQSLSLYLTSMQVTQIVPKGLSVYWGKALSKFSLNHTDYLGSVFREGGLPSNLLSSDSNNYKNSFFSVFERYQYAKDIGPIAIEKLVKSRITSLPVTLQTDATVNLITNMADKLDGLVYQFSLDKQDNPAKYLDEQYPRWRESFPLPLESSVGSAFLSQLLSRASKEVRKVIRAKKQLDCHHYISFANQAVYTEVTLPQSCIFDLSKNQLQTSRVELAIFEGDKQVAALGTGFAVFENDVTSVRMRNLFVLLRREKSTSELYIVAMQGGRKLAEIRLLTSSIDIGESPITVVEKDDKWLILSQSSIKTKYPKVGVLVSPAAVFNLEYGEITDSALTFGVNIFKVLEGKCCITFNETEKYVVVTHSDASHYTDFTLKGEQLLWKTVPPLVFKGVPTVRKDASYSDLDYVEQTSTYLNNCAIAELSPSELYGRQLLTVKTSDGLIKLRKQIGILPKDFEIELVNGEKPTQGIIRVKTNSPCTLSVISKHVEVLSSKKIAGMKEIVVDAIDKVPATVALSIRANILSEPIVIEVPFPARGAIAYNRYDQPLAQRLTVKELFGSRLHFFSTQGVPANFQIEAISKVSKGNCTAPYYRWHYKVTDKPLEVSLYALKDSILELLSLSEQLDDEVELLVTGPGRSLRFLISHYSTMLEHDRSLNTVSARSSATANMTKIKPILMSLSTPSQKPHALTSRKSEGVDTGEYELPSFIENDGPWLMIPDRGSDIAFRAKFFAGCNASSNNEEVKTLQKAAQMYHPQDNRHVIADVLRQMSSNWTHSGWQYLRDTYKNFGYLPLPTFEIWRHLLRDDRALAVALFVFENDEKFIAHLERELPIFWEFISIEHWQHAVFLMRDTLGKIGLPEAILKPMIKSNIEKLGQAIPALSETVVDWLVNENKPQCMPTALMQIMAEGWYQDLLHLHSEDDHWPTEYGNDLKQICIERHLVPFDIKVNVGFQAGVVYLPLFAAAMASGLIPAIILDNLPKDTIFHLRKLRDFDREWFEPMFRCFIAHFAHHTK